MSSMSLRVPHGAGRFFLDPSVLHDLELLFERDAGRSQDVEHVKPELPGEWAYLRNKLPE